MRVSVDISIFTTDGGAFGNAHGAIDFEVVPQVGDTISFSSPKVAGLARARSFTGMLRVKDRILRAGHNSELVSIAMEDLTVPTVEDAQTVAHFLEKGFGLLVDIY